LRLLWAWTTDTGSTLLPKKDSKMNNLVARLRVRALGMATRLVPAPTPFMFTGPGSSTQLVQMIADRGARSALVVTDAVLLELKVVDPVLVALEEAGIKAQVFSDVEPDPTIDVVMDGVARLRESRADAVLAVGGGFARASRPLEAPSLRRKRATPSPPKWLARQSRKRPRRQEAQPSRLKL